VRITHDDHGQLVIVDFPWLIGALFFPAAALCVARTAMEIARGGRNKRELIGAAIGAAIGFLVGALFTKRGEFAFDLVARKLTWRRRSLFRRAAGVVPLAEVREAIVQMTASRDQGTPMYRLAVSTDAGIVPLTDNYSTGEETPNRIRDRINAALNVTSSADHHTESEILELALAGKKIDAIRLARARYGYGLAEAKAFVDALQK
jgi:hypothetical protein